MHSAFIDRAGHARDCISRVPPSAMGDYLTAVKGLPAEIRLISLGQALATLRANDQLGHRMLYEHVEDWVRTCRMYATQPPLPLFEAIIYGDRGSRGQPDAAVQQKYRSVVAEIDAHLAILKRLADVFLGDKGSAPQTNNPPRIAAP